VRLLLDTHILVWLAKRPEKLTAADCALLARPEAQFLVSSASIWELRIKWIGRRAAARDELLEPFEAIAFAEQQGFELAALAPADTATSLAVPLGHRDPFDEMLLIHADRLGGRLLTRDRLLAGHPLAYRAA
jgi:PIN domain nuclease of toxin-antitoxin system